MDGGRTAKLDSNNGNEYVLQFVIVLLTMGFLFITYSDSLEHPLLMIISCLNKLLCWGFICIQKIYMIAPLIKHIHLRKFLHFPCILMAFSATFGRYPGFNSHLRHVESFSGTRGKLTAFPGYLMPFAFNLELSSQVKSLRAKITDDHQTSIAFHPLREVSLVPSRK